MSGKARIGLDGHGLGGIEIRQARLACQARQAVHFRAARAALGGPCSSSGRRGRVPRVPGSSAGRRARPSLLPPGRRSRQDGRGCGTRKTLKCASAIEPSVVIARRRGSGEFARHLGQLGSLDRHAAVAGQRHDAVAGAPVLVVGFRMVQSAMRAAALGPLPGAARHSPPRPSAWRAARRRNSSRGCTRDRRRP